MSSPLKYTLTNESVTVIFDGKPHVVQEGSPHYKALRKAILEEDWDKVPEHLTVAKSLKEWAQGDFTLVGNTFSYKGEQLPHDLNSRIIKMATGGEDPVSLFKFWERLQKNPSFRSVQQLWGFLNQVGIPLTEDGHFLAYKSVKNNYRDHHSGTFDNSPGRVNQMSRNKISDDPAVECDVGFHVGAMEYARDVMPGGRMVVCKVDPADVVCVPRDHSQKKVRVCKYEVIGNHNGAYLPDTSVTKEDIELEEEDPEIDESNEREAFADSPEGEEGDEDEGEAASLPGAPKPSARKLSGKNKDPLPRKKHKYDTLDMSNLMEQSIEDLRKYASNFLRIVGASKIPGGKSALVAKITGTR
jgi:hypothetical protein